MRSWDPWTSGNDAQASILIGLREGDLPRFTGRRDGFRVAPLANRTAARCGTLFGIKAP